MSDDTATKTSTKRYIYNDVDMEEWRTSPLKQDLLRVVNAMGKSCASSSTKYYCYNPNQPLKELSPVMSCFHGSLCQMIEWLEHDVPPLDANSDSNSNGGAAAGGGMFPAIRFGNPAFKTWHARLAERSYAVIHEMYLVYQEYHFNTTKNDDNTDDTTKILQMARDRGYQAAATGMTSSSKKQSSSSTETTETDDPPPPYIQEITEYLQDAFGHPIRLDYGTGHESSFMVVLYCFCKLGWMDETTTATGTGTTAGAAPNSKTGTIISSEPPSMLKLKATTLSIFYAYLHVTRQLQTKYRLEPAGSHGVWGLDDYHCLPFYFGACQCQDLSLVQQQQQRQNDPNDNNNNNDNDIIMVDEIPKPSDITNESIRKQCNSILLYFSCMDYICTLKSGAPLFEVSPMLYDISQTCTTWSKVSNGLLKLYEGEVLNKRQVVQHFTFGQHLFRATWKPSQTSPNVAPTTNFRTTDATGNHQRHQQQPPMGAVAPMVRAPWATDGDGGTTTTSSSSSRTNAALLGDTMGRAPWATTKNTNNSSSNNNTTSNNKNDNPSSSSTTGGSTGGEHPNMPPPGTRAPWAK